MGTSPVPDERWKTTVPARAEVVGELRRELTSFARGIGACDVALDGVALAVSEALSNVVVHAYADRQPGPITVEAWPDGVGHLFVEVSDEGKGMLPRPDSPGMGMGIPLMTAMADDMRVISRDEPLGTVVALRFSLDGSGVRLAADDLPSRATPEPS